MYVPSKNWKMLVAVSLMLLPLAARSPWNRANAGASAYHGLVDVFGSLEGACLSVFWIVCYGKEPALAGALRLDNTFQRVVFTLLVDHLINQSKNRKRNGLPKSSLTGRNVRSRQKLHKWPGQTKVTGIIQKSDNLLFNFIYQLFHYFIIPENG